LFIKWVLRIPLRLDEEILAKGDDLLHRESPYTYMPGFVPAIEMNNLNGAPPKSVPNRPGQANLSPESPHV
jgi:hypothetical protein